MASLAHERKRKKEDGHEVAVLTAFVGPSMLAGRLVPYMLDLDLSHHYLVKNLGKKCVLYEQSFEGMSNRLSTDNSTGRDSLKKAIEIFTKHVLNNAKEVVKNHETHTKGITIVQRSKRKGEEGSHKLWTMDLIEKSKAMFKREMKDAVTQKRRIFMNMTCLADDVLSEERRHRTGFGRRGGSSKKKFIRVSKHFVLHYLKSDKAKWNNFTSFPMSSLVHGFFFDGEDAKAYADLFGRQTPNADDFKHMRTLSLYRLRSPLSNMSIMDTVSLKSEVRPSTNATLIISTLWALSNPTSSTSSSSSCSFGRTISSGYLTRM